jgi:hypothetical protein
MTLFTNFQIALLLSGTTSRILRHSNHYSSQTQIRQCNETNVMHFSFSILRIKGLYMFRTLHVYPQEALHKQHLVYCVRMSVGCATIALQSWHCQRYYTHAIYEVPFVHHLVRIGK